MNRVGRITIQKKFVAASFVLAMVLFQAFWLGLPAIFLSFILILSCGLWLSTGWQVRPGLQKVFGLAILVFLAHVTEEYLAGLQEELPALFDRAAWSGFRYLVFNGVWAVTFITAAATLRSNSRLPVLIVLFFAIAGGVGNGALHLLLVVWRGGYFPGAWTAPLCFGMGVWLLRLLYRRSVV